MSRSFAVELLPPSASAEEAQATMLVRLQGEFLEMPGLRLTLAQAARLWHLDLTTTSSLLQALVDNHFLTARDGRYARSAV